MTGEPQGLHEPLRPQDRFFLDQEAPGTTMNVGALVTVEGRSPDTLLDDVIDVFASRLHLLPRLRQRIVEVPLEGADPVWADDPAFDLARRVKLMPFTESPTRRELLASAGQRVADPLRRSEPLWDVAVVPRTATGESALILRWHHALIDGMSGVEIGKLLLSTERLAATSPPEPWMPAPLPDGEQLVAEALALRATDAFRSAALRTLPGAHPGPTIPYDELISGARSFVRLGRMPPNPFPPTRPGSRRYVSAQVADSELRAVRRRHGVSLEAIVLTSIAEATSRLGRARGEQVDRLRVFVPRTVAFRGRSQGLGNHSTFNVVDLPLGETSAAARLADVADRLDTLRESRQSEAVSAVTEFISAGPRLPTAMNQAIARWFGAQQYVHAIVSYMRGPRQPLFLAGRSHLGTCPILPRSDGVGALFGVVSIGGVTTFGIVADSGAIPELEFLATAIERSLADLVRDDV